MVLRSNSSTDNDTVEVETVTNTKSLSSSSSSSSSILPHKRKSRDIRQPRSILDRDQLLKALQKANVQLKPKQLESFYQQLHRQHYPSLSEFVRNYHQNEENSDEAQTTVRQSSESPKDENKPVSQGEKSRKNNHTARRKKKNLVQLPKAFLKFLESHDFDNPKCNVMNDEYSLNQIPPFSTLTSHVSHHATSANGDTTKLAITLQGNHQHQYHQRQPHDHSDHTHKEEPFTVETVIMRHAGSRITLCVSSQVGCAMQCSFCATGTMGIRGNLNSGEILEQVVHAERFLREQSELDDRFQTKKYEMMEEAEAEARQQDKSIHNARKKFVNPNALSRVRNIVFMGMGEPLNNYKNVVMACQGLMDRRRWNLAYDRITVSTVGVTPKMKMLTQDLPQVNLALSLHAPNQSLRESIVPTAKRYPIEGIIEALDGHMRGGRSLEDLSEEELKAEIGAGRRKAMVEYVMLNGPTSTLEAAHELGKLCSNRNLVVNLIPYNQTDVKDKLSCPSNEHMKTFQDIVTSYGVFCFIRRTMGADIAGACGQLVVEKEKRENQNGNDNVDVDIEDVVPDKAKTTTMTRLAKRETKARGSLRTSSNGSVLENVEKAANKKKKVVLVVEGDNGKKASTKRKTYSDKDLEKWIMPLATATAIAGTTLIISSTMLVLQKYRR